MTGMAASLPMSSQCLGAGFPCFLLSERLFLYHEVFRANSIQELELSWFGEHGFGNGEIFFVIVFGNLVLDDESERLAAIKIIYAK